MVEDGYETSTLAEREKLAIGLADGYLGFPAGVDKDLAHKVSAAFSEAEIAAMLVALMTFNFASRCAVSLGGMPEEGTLPITEISVSAVA
jgi:hypothetical protein